MDCLVGIAGSSFRSEGTAAMAEAALKKLLGATDRQYGPKQLVIETLSFKEAVELLRALTLGEWDPDFAKSMRFVQATSLLLDRINAMNFDLIGHELEFGEFDQLYDAYVALKLSDIDELKELGKAKFTNQSLVGAFEQREFSEYMFPETFAGKYDPLKPRVLTGLAQSLLKSEQVEDLRVMSNPLILEGHDATFLERFQETTEMAGINKPVYPYRPDVVFGYQGRKIGLFVQNDDCVMRDTHQPDGFTAAKMRLVEKAHRENGPAGTAAIKSISLPVSSVVSANLKEHRLELRSDFKLNDFLR